MSTAQHDVLLDRAGWSGRARLTCYEPGCNGATLIAQPYMSQSVWDEASAAFLDEHQCANPRVDRS